MSDIDEKMKKVYRLRRARQLALAILQRARDAGIPEQHMRIKEEEFKELVSEKFHKEGKDIVASSIYNEPDTLFNRSFITIDGGDVEVRKRAGFAILFRLIACDKSGFHENCASLVHKFQSFKATEGISRNDLAESLKEYDVLFISECRIQIFNPSHESGSFFDEVLGYRSDHNKLTIISFSDAITKDDPMARKDKDCGEYLSTLIQRYETDNTVYRIRVEQEKKA